eukprot:sb/3466733/
MATREVITDSSYSNWDVNHPQRGYAYMVAATGKWKSMLTSEDVTTRGVWFPSVNLLILVVKAVLVTRRVVLWIVLAVKFDITCSAIGEPVPEMKITDATEFQPDLTMSPKKGQLGLKTSTKTFRITAGITPSQITCYAWNVNGVAKSSGNFKVIPSSDTSMNPSVAADGYIRMPPLVRLGIESLALGQKYAQKMRCVVTGAPKPDVIIVRLQSGSNTFPPVHNNAEQGIHNVVAEEVVIINGEEDTGRFACLASNKYGAVKEIATLSFVDKAPTPTSANMAMTAAQFKKDPVQIPDWPLTASKQLPSYDYSSHIFCKRGLEHNKR